MVDTRLLTYNVRGLNDKKKVRHLINYCIKEQSQCSDLICTLQETYIENHGLFPYLWRGNLYITPGNGNSCGYITLLSHHLNIIESKDLGDRGHILALQKIGCQEIGYIVANIYAPNPNNNQKIDFFDNAFDSVLLFQERYDCPNIIIAGDYNVVLKAAETKNRSFNSQEKRVADFIINFLKELKLNDIW